QQQGPCGSDITGHVRAHIRYAGTDTALEVPAFSFNGWIFFSGDEGIQDLLISTWDEDEPGPPDRLGKQQQKMKAAFEALHKARFGFIDERKPLVVGALSVEAIGSGAKPADPPLPIPTAPAPAPPPRPRFYSGGRWHQAAVFPRDQLRPGHKVPGPAII